MYMQNPVIMAFRKRLKKRGYKDVSIKFNKESGLYVISALEPLANTLINVEYSIDRMFRSFRF